jgi:ribosomal protein L7/L12
MVPVTDVLLEDLGPNQAEVLKVVDSLLHCGYLAIVRSVKEKPLLIATDESFRVAALVQKLRELGARVTWTAHNTH